jgi:hypothetical protein
MVEIHQHVIVELLGIVNGDLFWDAVAIDYVLLEEFLDSHGAYICDRLHLDPFHEIVDHYDSEGVVVVG